MWLGRIKYFRFFFVACTAPLRLYMGSVLTGGTIPTACLLLPYFFMVGAQSCKIRAEYPNKTSFWVDGFCLSASTVVLVHHYMSGGIVTNTDAGFCIVVVLANIVYLLLPMFFPGLASALVGADTPSRKTA